MAIVCAADRSVVETVDRSGYPIVMVVPLVFRNGA